MKTVAGARTSLWRTFRRRARALWRWMVVRTLRTWMRGRAERTDVKAALGDVRQFPIR